MRQTDLCILIGTLGGGGAERIAINIAEHLSKTHSILLTILIKLKSEKYISKIKPHYLIKKNTSPLILYLGFPIIVIKYLLLLFVKRPQAVLSILCLENILNMCISPIFKVKSVISIHDIRSQTIQTAVRFKFLIPIEMFLLKYTKATAIAVSDGAKKDLIINFGIPANKIQVIYNPINVDAIQKLSSEVIPKEIIQSKYPTIITVGRLTAVKAQWHLIRVFAEIHKKSQVSLLICGVGEEEAYLKKLVTDLGVNDDVIFLEWQANPYKYMAHSTVFVLSSLSESFGNVLVEAMASGCPVISANCSLGVCELIGYNNDYGLLAESMTGERHSFDEPLDSSEQSLLDSIRKIMDNPKLREHYIEKGKIRAEFFSTEQKTKEYELFIHKLIK